MSNLNTNATVTLNVNGQQAAQTMATLKQNALQLQQAIAKAAAAGDKVELKRLRKELTDTKRQMREMESVTMQVEHVLLRLDKASPRELQKTLKTLQNQLEYIERGSNAWKAHTEKIRKVKAELNALNAEMREGEGFWTRFNRTLNDWQTSLMGAIAALTGLILAGRSAVKSFAEMDEQLADTRKYTGLAEEQVKELNDEFKEMDTRSSREQLNLLAQEAGRLGKNTKEDVLGYVEAADIINVALVDLGNGATQTIAKLTNIFRVDEEMGTRDSMLAVGSAVNVLSQNCTASKQFLVEFTQRMAGVGAQADLTIPQLLAYGATLDANGQKTEMSASALGKLTMMIFQKPKEIAQQVGLDVQKFTETLQRSTNDGLIMFLERIQQLGSKEGLAVLAPLFKDLGMDGVRMSQVLGTLAEHLDMVKWEQEEANKAFKEATSATHEYEIFNNTVQAGLDKAKKRISELAIELGEKLLPIMRHVYSSTSLTLRVLSAIVDFFIEYKGAILSAAATMAAYTLVVNANNIAFKVHYAWLVITQTAQKALAATTATLRTAWVLLQIAMAKIEGNYARVKWLQVELNTAMKANALGLIAAGAVALIAVFVKLYQRMKEIKEAQDVLNSIKKEAVSKSQEQVDSINLLVAAAKNEKLSLEERQRAIDKLNKTVPEYNGHLDTTTGKYTENKKALDKYIESLVRMYEIEGAKDKLAEIGRQKADLNIQKKQVETEKEEAEKKAAAAKKQNQTHPQVKAHGRSAMDADVDYIYAEADRSWDAAIKAKQKQIDNLDKQIKEQTEQEKVIMKVYGTDLQKQEIAAPSTDGGGDGGGDSYTPSSDSSGGGSKNKFQAEEDWRTQEEALNRIAYAKGEKDFLAYTNRMTEIELEFNKKKLDHTDLTKTERLSIEATYYEASKKQGDEARKQSVEAENAAYAEEMATEKQRYIDGLISLEVYETTSAQMEMRHLNNLASLYEEGSKEQLQAQRQLQDLLLADKKKHQQEFEREEKKHQEELKRIKDKVFGNSVAENAALYQKQLANLKLVYQAELAAAGNNAKEKLRIEKAFQQAKLALMKQYNQEGARENMNAMEKWNEDITNFLNSDVGQAITGSLDVLVSGMSSMFSGLSNLIQAELEIQTAAVEKKYDREIDLAEGNKYKTKKLEEQKQAEIAKLKNEANKKMFAMQVIQAVAQTATSAINAYSSAAQVPLVGYILAPIAASMAVAAGAIQIATIKKQQQASEAQGYMSGGFTPKGRKDIEVGVVHAGEWVASQDLVNSPVARPLIDALDYAQRTNTIGSLSARDVSATITAPRVLAENANRVLAMPAPVVESNPSTNAQSSVLADVADALGNLTQRLDEPFLTVNSVTGDLGMQQAQDEYDRLIRNKTPKSRR